MPEDLTGREGLAGAEAPEHERTNLARGEWQVSRVYVLLGRAETAIWHARRCLEHCEEAGISKDTRAGSPSVKFLTTCPVAS